MLLLCTSVMYCARSLQLGMASTPPKLARRFAFALIAALSSRRAIVEYLSISSKIGDDEDPRGESRPFAAIAMCGSDTAEDRSRS